MNKRTTQISCLMGYWSHILYSRVLYFYVVLLIYKLSCTQISKELKSVSHIKLSMLGDPQNHHTLIQKETLNNIYTKDLKILSLGTTQFYEQLKRLFRGHRKSSPSSTSILNPIQAYVGVTGRRENKWFLALHSLKITGLDQLLHFTAKKSNSGRIRW